MCVKDGVDPHTSSGPAPDIVGVVFSDLGLHLSGHRGFGIQLREDSGQQLSKSDASSFSFGVVSKDFCDHSRFVTARVVRQL